MEFGNWVKNRRIGLRIGLREFCKRVNVDPSYWSKVERGLQKVSYTGELEQRLTDVLGLNYEERKQLYFRARFQTFSNIARTKEDLHLMLPVFVCVANGRQPTKGQLIELAKTVLEMAETN